MRKFLILLIFVLVSLPASAQWRRAALYGADVRALIIDPNAPDTLYLGTSSGEVYVSDDAATSWINPFRGTPFPGHVVDNLLVDRAGRLWAACWGLWGGGAIAVSEDRGKTWTRRDAGLEEFSVRAIAVDPNDENFLLAGGLTGVYRTEDGGQSWEKISEQINVESLAIDPRTRDRIYVGTWRQGIRTEDGGKSWALINNGMVLDTDMFAITIEADNPDSLWVSTCGWVYNTQNRGDKWTRYRDGFTNRRIHDIKVDPCNKESIYAGSVAGLYRSEDRGKSWYTVSDESWTINSIAVHPQRPNRIILGVEGDGVYVSNDNAKTFKRASNGLHNLRITTIVADPLVKDRVYAAVVFGGAASGIYRSDDGGANWEKLGTNALPEVLTLTIASETETAEPRFVVGTDKGFFFSNDAKQWTQAPPANIAVRVDKVLRFNRTRFFAATSHGVFTSRDGGKVWYRLAGADSRTVDIAVGFLGDKRALFALTDAGLTAFDGDKWNPIADAPTKGRTLAIRSVGGAQHVIIAGAHGVRAGLVGEERRWTAADAPDAQYAAVFGGNPLLFLTSKRLREVLVGDPTDADWRALALPSRHTEVTSIAPDPFSRDRFYVGTLGEGVYVFEGKTQKYVAKKPSSESTGAIAAGGTSK